MIFFLLKSTNHYHYTCRGGVLLPVTQQLLIKLTKVNFRKTTLIESFMLPLLTGKRCNWTLRMYWPADHRHAFFILRRHGRKSLFSSLYTWKRALQQGKVNPRASASVYIVLFCSECKLRRSLMTSCIWHWMFCLAWFCASAVSVRFFAHRKQKDEKQTKWSQITNSTVLNQVSALCSVR